MHTWSSSFLPCGRRRRRTRTGGRSKTRGTELANGWRGTVARTVFAQFAHRLRGVHAEAIAVARKVCSIDRTCPAVRGACLRHTWTPHKSACDHSRKPPGGDATSKRPVDQPMLKTTTTTAGCCSAVKSERVALFAVREWFPAAEFRTSGVEVTTPHDARW